MTNVVVMPVSAVAIEFLANGVKADAFPQQGEICQQLEGQLAWQFQFRGFKVVQSKLATGSPAIITNDVSHNREIWMQLQVQRAYQTLARIQGRARGHLVRPEAPLLANYEKADALVFVTACIVTESSGARNERMAFNVAATTIGLAAMVLGSSSTAPFVAGSPEGSTLEVILVEGRTGEVLWRNWTNTDSRDQERLAQAVPELFIDYPDQQKYH